MKEELASQFKKAEDSIQKVIVKIQETATLNEFDKINEFWRDLKAFERLAERIETKKEEKCSR